MNRAIKQSADYINLAGSIFNRHLVRDVVLRKRRYFMIYPYRLNIMFPPTKSFFLSGFQKESFGFEDEETALATFNELKKICPISNFYGIGEKTLADEDPDMLILPVSFSILVGFWSFLHVFS